MRNRALSYYSWFVLAYTVAVILWGAYVRATGSGAGCGNHWPLCNGEVIPRAEEAATAIEFTHRLMTGVLLPLVLILAVWVFRRHPKGETARLGAVVSLVFLAIEALIGAGLVRFELVADNSSAARALAVSLHLANTLLLLASLALTSWWVSGGSQIHLRGSGTRGWALSIALAGLILVGATGAVTALGDTLFPAASLAEGLRADLSPTASFLVRLRVVHPLLAILTGAYTAGIALAYGPIRRELSREASAWQVAALVVIQVSLGAVNMVLLAPVWMQMVHLLTADLLWIAVVLFGADLLRDPGRQTEAANAVSQEYNRRAAPGD